MHDALLVLRGCGDRGSARTGCAEAWSALARLGRAADRPPADRAVDRGPRRRARRVRRLRRRGRRRRDAHQLGTDRAQLLVTTATHGRAGARALAAAVAALGAEGVAALLPYLQTAAFSPSLRRALKAAEGRRRRAPQARRRGGRRRAAGAREAAARLAVVGRAARAARLRLDVDPDGAAHVDWDAGRLTRSRTPPGGGWPRVRRRPAPAAGPGGRDARHGAGQRSRSARSTCCSSPPGT